MAFQPPAAADRRQQISSITSHPIQEHHEFYIDSPTSPTVSRRFDLPAEPEEEWIVFSPSVTVEPSNFTPTEIGTNDGRHGPSDFWTEGTESRLGETQDYSSYNEDEELDSDEEEDPMAYHDQYMRGVDDDEDSLQAFRENPVLLPTHDGRGRFPSQSGEEDVTVFMPGVESLERSLRLLASRHSNIFEEEDDVNSRIQKWRLEHSSAFMEEIQEAKNRNARAGYPRTQSARALREEMEASMMVEDEDFHSEASSMRGSQRMKGQHDEVPETFWRKITRSLMRDIMGIDDTVLEVIFGESLPPQAMNQQAPQTQNEIIGEKWERSLLERIARELGILLQHYTIHPTEGAFSTYTRSNSSLMLPEEQTKLEGDGGATPKARSLRSATSLAQLPALSNTGDTVTDSADPADKVQFMPTLSQRRRNGASPRPKLYTEAETQEVNKKKAILEANIDAQSRKEYWEQELGVSVFFSYLKSRFSSSSTPSSPPSPSTKTLRKAASTADIHRPIYHQHPLLQRRQQNRRSGSVSSQSTPAAMANSWGLLGLGGFRNGSSCASQSTKTSKAGQSKGKGKGNQGPASTLSKGFYWEVDTSVSSTGGGSCVGMGIWGEI